MKEPDANSTNYRQELMPDIVPAISKRCGKIIVAGPCSAESREQVLDIARQLRKLNVDMFRAGIWKPRTSPESFEGCGSEGLRWLTEVKQQTGMPVATEVASPSHLRQAIAAGIDAIWLGARTTANPFAVQEIANELSHAPHAVMVMVKNPVIPDIDLWIGAIQRLYNAGARHITAIHRGFAAYKSDIYRYPPQWDIPIELRRRMPHLQLIFDPSHTGGKRELVGPLAAEAYSLGFDGLIVEVHNNPDIALSDAPQQITPGQLSEIITSLKLPANLSATEEIALLRGRIDSVDSQLIELLASRMEITDAVGRVKLKNNLPVLQPDRYHELMQSRTSRAISLGLDQTFVEKYLSLLHAESVRRQLAMLKKS